MVTVSGGFGDLYCPLGMWVGSVEGIHRWGTIGVTSLTSSSTLAFICI